MEASLRSLKKKSSADLQTIYYVCLLFETQHPHLNVVIYIFKASIVECLNNPTLFSGLIL